MSPVVLTALAWVGWSIALAAGLALRRRRALEADAAHELRGAAMAIGLAVERMERGAPAAELGPLVRLQLARVGGALSDLGPAARGSLDVERLAQVVANVAANAAEHGVGPVEVTARRDERVVCLDVRNARRGGVGELPSDRAGRGRGIAIAQRAARSLGGRVRVQSEGGVTRAVIELPVGEAQERGGPGDDYPRAA